MTGAFDAFARFEHEGWERVAPRYEELWTSLSAQFAGPLLAAADVRRGQRVLDLCCGPGVVTAAAHRIAAAEQLLKGTALSMKEIAGAVGYRHPSEFTRHFKKVWTETPVAFRAKLALRQ